FDRVLEGFGNLSSTQFLSVVYTGLGLPFVVTVILIILSYRSSTHQNSTGARVEAGLMYVFVHETDNKTKGIADAEVRLVLPEPKIARTDPTGGAKFAFPAECAGNTYSINAHKDGYVAGREKRV